MLHTLSLLYLFVHRFKKTQDKSVVLKWSNIDTKLQLVQIEKSNFQIQNEVSPAKSTSSSTESVVISFIKYIL